MKIDYHVHLEEGPYSFRWLEKTYHNLLTGQPISELKHSKQWLSKSLLLLSERMAKGAYDPSWLDLYLENAKKKGLKEVGIVDHLYRFTESRNYFKKHILLDDSRLGSLQKQWLDLVMTESMGDFVQAITASKEKWEKQGIKLKIGLEADYFEAGEDELTEILGKHDWDFIHGSVHFVRGWGFDNPQTKDEFKKYDLYELYKEFFQTIENATRSGLFDFISHLDNLKVFGYRPNESELLPLYKKVVKALKQMNVATEINAGLYYRFPVKEICPSETFLDLLIEENIPLLISSDAHFPEDIGAFVHENIKMLQQKGVKEIATFEKRNRVMKPLSF
jgi:histidinol-phosphatase (PHP family)